GARGGARARHPPSCERLVGIRSHTGEVGFDAPFALDRGRVAGALLRRLAPRILVIGPRSLRIGAVEGKCAHTLRICGSEQDCEGSAFGIPEQWSAVTAGSVHHGTHV